MIKSYKIIPLAALLMAASWQSANAQSTQVDEVLVLNFHLTGVSQGPTTTTTSGVTADVKVSEITSRDVIRVLGTATGNSFSSKARLEILAPTNDLENWTVQISDGTKTVDVTSFVGHQPGGASVGSAWVTRRTGAAGGTEYSIDGFNLQDQPGFPALTEHFSVSGFTVTTERGVVNRRGQIVGQMDSIQADVSGTGDLNGQLLIIGGSLDAEGIGTVTITTSNPGPS